MQIGEFIPMKRGEGDYYGKKSIVKTLMMNWLTMHLNLNMKLLWLVKSESLHLFFQSLRDHHVPCRDSLTSHMTSERSSRHEQPHRE